MMYSSEVNNEMQSYVVRQIKISETIYRKIKMFCIGRDISLKKFYSDMVEQFFADLQQGKEFQYLAGKKSGQRMSIYIPRGYVERIKQLAMLHDVSEACIIYTAFVNYLSYLSL